MAGRSAFHLCDESRHHCESGGCRQGSMGLPPRTATLRQVLDLSRMTAFLKESIRRGAKTRLRGGRRRFGRVCGGQSPLRRSEGEGPGAGGGAVGRKPPGADARRLHLRDGARPLRLGLRRRGRAAPEPPGDPSSPRPGARGVVFDQRDGFQPGPPAGFRELGRQRAAELVLRALPALLQAHGDLQPRGRRLPGRRGALARHRAGGEAPSRCRVPRGLRAGRLSPVPTTSTAAGARGSGSWT